MIKWIKTQDGTLLNVAHVAVIRVDAVDIWAVISGVPQDESLVRLWHSRAPSELKRMADAITAEVKDS